ncbi:MAG: alpha/beta fold hydrolase [Solirubrobacteraceae bacterium]
MGERVVQHGRVSLAAEDVGVGVPVVLLHGLTATRRYVVMGSRVLERSEHRVISYDARGHGRSSPAPEPTAYDYDDLGRDLLAVLDELEIDRAVFAGASMGAHTALGLALKRPERAAGLVVITPGYDPDTMQDQKRLARWDALASGLRQGGVEGFIEAWGEPRVPAEWQQTVLRVIRQRLALHEHPEAVADALSAVPRSRPFSGLEDLAQVSAPTVVIASADDPDPEHPEALARAYARAIPGARLITDEPGRSPIAWQGSQLSKVIASVAREAFA